MLVSKFLNKQIAASEAETIRVDGSVDTLVISLQNQDALNTLIYKFQESANGSDWTDITLPVSTGGTATQFQVAAGEVQSIKVTSSEQYLRIMASGDLMAGIGLQYQVDSDTDTTPYTINSG